MVISNGRQLGSSCVRQTAGTAFAISCWRLREGFYGKECVALETLSGGPCGESLHWTKRGQRLNAEEPVRTPVRERRR